MLQIRSERQEIIGHCRACPAASLTRRSAFLVAALLVGVAVVVAAVHWPALSAQAISFDDNQYFVENPLVRNPSWSSAGRFLGEILKPSTVGGYYQPLSMISLMLDYAMGGREAYLLPFHRTSLCLHVANTLLVMVLVYLLFGHPWAAAMVGLLFGVHPMTVEPICWVGERKTLLAAFFVLWSLVFYVRYARGAGRKYYGAALVGCVLALMSKPTSIPLPALLLLLDVWPLRRLNKRAIAEKVPFFAIAGVSAAIAFASQSLTAAVITPDQGRWLRIPLIVCHDIVFYLYKILWPVNLSSHYPFPKPLAVSDPMVLAGVIGSGLLAAVLVVSLRWTRGLLVGWLFFFAAILPTMQVVRFSDVIASDKFAYLPSVGLLMVLAWGLARIWSSALGGSRAKMARLAVAALVAVVAASESVATRRYVVCWRDTVSLCEHMLSLAPGVAMLHFGLGNAHRQEGRLEQAAEAYGEALRIKPEYAEAHNNLGITLAGEGKRGRAAEEFATAVAIKPDYAEAHTNLGVALMWQGKLDEAASHCSEALRLEPQNIDAHINMGAVLARVGKLDQAVEHYVTVLRIVPGNYKAHSNLGILLARLGRLDEAIKHYAEALQAKPDSAGTHLNMGVALERQGRIDEGVAHLVEAVRLQPGLVVGHLHLARALAELGKVDQAVREYKEALRLDPNNAKARAGLEAALRERTKGSGQSRREDQR